MKRYLLLVWCVAAVISSPVFAQSSGKEAFDDWLKSYSDLGMEATYSSADEAGDRLSVRDFRLSYSLTVPGDEQTKAGQTKVDFSWTTPELVAVGFAGGKDGYSVDRLTLSDDTSFDAKVDAENGSDISLKGSVEGYLLVDAFWPHYPEIEDDANRPVSRWLPVLQTIAEYEIAENRVARMAFTMTESGGSDPSQTISYDIRDLLVKDIRDGIVGRYATGLFSQTAPITDENGNPVDVKITMAGSQAIRYDLKALFSLFDPALAENSDFVSALDSMTAQDYRIEAGPVKVAIDRIAYEDFAVRPPETRILPLLDGILSGQDVDEAKLGIALFDVYRAIAIGRMSIDGVSIEFPDPENPSATASAEMGKMLVSELSAEGLGEFSVSSVKANAGSGGTFRLGKFSVGDIEFAPYGPMKALIERFIAGSGEPDPLEVARAFMPRSISMGIDDLFIRVPGEMEGGLDRHRLSLRTSVPPVPTEIELSVEGLELPVSAIEDEQARAMLTAAGIDRLRLTEDLKIRWDEQSEDLIVENLVIDVAPIGVVRAKARLGGMPKSVLQNPEQIQAAVATLSLKSLDFDVINAGGVEAALKLAARQSGANKDQMVQFLRFQLSNALAMVGDDSFTTMVTSAAEKFFADPRDLSISFAPENPVPVLQIIASAGIAPQALPGLLGVSVKANSCTEVAEETTTALEDRTC